MAFTVVLALTARAAAVADLRAGGRRAVRARHGRGAREPRHARGAARLRAAAARWRCGVAARGRRGAVLVVALGGAARDAHGQRSSSRASTRATSRCTRCAFPAPASTQAIEMQHALEARIAAVARGRARVREARHGRGRHRPDAADRRRHLHHAEGPRDDWPDPRKPKDAARRASSKRCGRAVPGQQLRVHAADPDALQRADLRRARRRRGQGVRRRSRPRCVELGEQIEAIARGRRRAPPTSRSSR